jgi:hypothetical protein
VVMVMGDGLVVMVMVMKDGLAVMVMGDGLVVTRDGSLVMGDSL